MTESQLDAVNARHGVPRQFRECHLALVDNYVIGGHVPVEEINRMLKEKPPILGLVVEGMPIGSPGMEGAKPQRYDVLALDRQGRASLYASK